MLWAALLALFDGDFLNTLMNILSNSECSVLQFGTMMINCSGQAF